MADQVSFPELAGLIGEVVRAVMDEIQPRLVQAALSGDRSERANTRRADNFLSPQITILDSDGGCADGQR